MNTIPPKCWTYCIMPKVWNWQRPRTSWYFIDEYLFDSRESTRKGIFAIGALKQIKERNPHVIIGVGGCVASQKGMLATRAPVVDVVFGAEQHAPDLIQQVRSERKPVVDISFPEIEKFDNLPEPRAESRRLCRSWKDAANIARRYCRLHAAKKFHALLMMYWLKWRNQRHRAYAK